MGYKFNQPNTQPDDPRATEYGGMPGLIQAAPHDVQESPREMLLQIYHTNPAAGYIDGTNPVETQEIPQVKSVG